VIKSPGSILREVHFDFPPALLPSAASENIVLSALFASLNYKPVIFLAIVSLINSSVVQLTN
jgi:hypothetical protein